MALPKAINYYWESTMVVKITMNHCSYVKIKKYGNNPIYKVNYIETNNKKS